MPDERAISDYEVNDAGFYFGKIPDIAWCKSAALNRLHAYINKWNSIIGMQPIQRFTGEWSIWNGLLYYWN